MISLLLSSLTLSLLLVGVAVVHGHGDCGEEVMSLVFIAGGVVVATINIVLLCMVSNDEIKKGESRVRFRWRGRDQ